MRNKYILLNEVELDIIKTADGTVKMFEFKEIAVDWAKKKLNSWQVIEIPFEDAE